MTMKAIIMAFLFRAKPVTQRGTKLSDGKSTAFGIGPFHFIRTDVPALRLTCGICSLSITPKQDTNERVVDTTMSQGFC